MCNLPPRNPAAAPIGKFNKKLPISSKSNENVFANGIPAEAQMAIKTARLTTTSIEPAISPATQPYLRENQPPAKHPTKRQRYEKNKCALAGNARESSRVNIKPINPPAKVRIIIIQPVWHTFKPRAATGQCYYVDTYWHDTAIEVRFRIETIELKAHLI